jgi:hypothetical protein
MNNQGFTPLNSVAFNATASVSVSVISSNSAFNSLSESNISSRTSSGIKVAEWGTCKITFDSGSPAIISKFWKAIPRAGQLHEPA